jgi:hypothetical protein
MAGLESGVISLRNMLKRSEQVILQRLTAILLVPAPLAGSAESVALLWMRGIKPCFVTNRSEIEAHDLDTVDSFYKALGTDGYSRFPLVSALRIYPTRITANVLAPRTLHWSEYSMDRFTNVFAAPVRAFGRYGPISYLEEPCKREATADAPIRKGRYV